MLDLVAVFKVFYSWQSDLPNRTNRTLIQTALDKACQSLKSAGGVLAEAVVDRDTLGLAGSPSINDAILDKIRDSDAFVADVSIMNALPRSVSSQKGVSKYIHHAIDGLSWLRNDRVVPPRSCPNPNVLTELGYAMSQLGNEALVLVVNTHYGALDDLPFDVRPLRKLSYRASPQDDVSAIKTALARDFERALKEIAGVVKGDPVDTILYERTRQVAGQAQALLNDLARATGMVDNTVTEADLFRFFETLTREQLQEMCANINPNADAPLLLVNGAMKRNANWLEYMKYYRRRSGSFTSQILVFSPFLKREHAALLMRVEQSSHFMLLDLYDHPITNPTLVWLESTLWEYLQFALRLKQYAERELARRAAPF